MTNLTRQEIDAAIETLQSSFSYDPPDRWRAAHESLQPLRQELRRARRAFFWLRLVALASLVAFAAISMFSSLPPEAASLWIGFGGMLIVPGMINALADFLLERRTPLLKLQHKIEGVCRKFNEHIERPSETSHVAS